MEINGEQQASLFQQKASEASRQRKEPKNELVNGVVLRAATVIAEDNWEQWQRAPPTDTGFTRHFLAKTGSNGYGDCRPALIRAITSRWVAINREWCETLDLEDLL